MHRIYYLTLLLFITVCLLIYIGTVVYTKLVYSILLFSLRCFSVTLSVELYMNCVSHTETLVRSQIIFKHRDFWTLHKTFCNQFSTVLHPCPSAEVMLNMGMAEKHF